MASPQFGSFEWANAVYDFLVEYGGALEADRQSFVRFQLSDSHPTEWRFQGHFGYGGKFRRTSWKIYVDCYPEDITPHRQGLINKINGLLEPYGPPDPANQK